jgi:hypothetical protein
VCEDGEYGSGLDCRNVFFALFQKITAKQRRSEVTRRNINVSSRNFAPSLLRGKTVFEARQRHENRMNTRNSKTRLTIIETGIGRGWSLYI